MPEPLIHGDNIDITFGSNTVLNNVSFSIEAGSFSVLLGPNGAGKTQLLRVMLGLLEPSSGRMQRHFDRVSVGYVPQKLLIDPHFPITVREFLDIYFHPRTVLRAAPLPSFSQLFQIDTLLDKRIGHLSGGQLQRVLLAAALSTQPTVLFLDEFATGIDPRGQAELFNYLHRLNEKDHVTIVLVSHDIDITAQYADAVLCLNKNLICMGKPQDVFTQENFQKMYGLPLTIVNQHHHD
jgi:zinc transport system ATP-binding protein